MEDTKLKTLIFTIADEYDETYLNTVYTVSSGQTEETIKRKALETADNYIKMLKEEGFL